MSPALLAAIRSELVALESAGRYRSPLTLDGGSRSHPSLMGATVTSFCSNDYLGLSAHPALREAASRTIRDLGVGTGASRLVSGQVEAHITLESSLARYLKHPAVLTFPTGYQANIGALTALASAEDLIVSDAANHASLIDGCRLSRARTVIYRHGDAEDARKALLTNGNFRRRFLVTESLFSMDGDFAPLSDLSAAAQDAGAFLLVDEAHALGVLGPGGRGLCHAAGVTPDALLGTLGKAFGVSGGFVAGPAELRSLLVNRARTFIYTTASPPALAAAAATAVDLVSGDEGDRLRASVQDNARRLRAALGMGNDASTSPIVPVILGPEAAALEASAYLLTRGFFIQAIRPPTVPPGTSRLRVTLSASHSTAAVDELADLLNTLRHR